MKITMVTADLLIVHWLLVLAGFCVLPATLKLPWLSTCPSVFDPSVSFS